MPNELVDLNARNIGVWFALAFQAGAVNAGAFLACGRFVTHTTGFATHFSSELVHHHEGAAFSMLAVPLFFFFGAVITSFFVDLRLARRQTARYGWPCFLVFLSLLTATALGISGQFGLFDGQIVLHQDFVLLALLALASGLQNALVTNAGGVVVRTTHLTGMTTDLATGVVRSVFGNHHGTRFDRLATVARGGIIFSFIAGSTISAYLYLRVQFWGFALPTVTSLCILFYLSARIKRKELLMKSILLFLFAAQVSAIAAEPMPLLQSGTYAFQGDVHVDLRIHNQLVYAFTDAGAADLKRREAAGEQCEFRGDDTYLCRTFAKDVAAPAELLERLHAELDSQNLVLGESIGDPALLSKGDDAAEYSVNQPVSFLGKSYAGYRLDSTKAGWSIRLGEVTEAQFNVEGGEPRLTQELFVRKSREESEAYVLSSGFRRM